MQRVAILAGEAAPWAALAAIACCVKLGVSQGYESPTWLCGREEAAPPPDGLCICGECTGEPQGALWCGELVESCVGSCGGTWWAALALALVLAV
eukprot:jgi/Tetstr1/448155/TSEL_035447.t1